MDVVGDLLARDRRSRDPALETVEGRARTYHDLITNAYKAANVLRHLGAREGSTVSVPPEPGFHQVLAFLGAARLGARVRFDPEAGTADGDRVVLVPVAEEPAVVPKPGTNLAVFGGPPERPETTHWEAELWSENPGTPPSAVAPDDPVILDARPDGSEPRRNVSHAALLTAARSIVDDHALGPGSRVVVRATVREPGVVAAGIVAPLYAGATIVLAGTDPLTSDEPRGDLAIVGAPDGAGNAGDLGETGDAVRSPVPEPERIRPPAIPS